MFNMTYIYRTWEVHHLPCFRMLHNKLGKHEYHPPHEGWYSEKSNRMVDNPSLPELGYDREHGWCIKFKCPGRK